MSKKIVLPIFALLLILSVGFGVNSVFANGDAPPEDEWETLDYPDWYLISAQAMDMDEDALWEALEKSETILAVAQSQGISEEKIIDAIIATEKEFTKSLVADEMLTQEEADEWMAEIPEDVKLFLNESWAWDADKGVDWFTITAETLNMDEDSLFEALETEETLLAVVKKEGSSEKAIADAIVSAEEKLAKEFVTNEDISQEDLDEWMAEIPEEVKLFLNESWAWTDMDFPDWFIISAESLSIDEDALWDALDKGQSIADLAEEKGVDLQKVITALSEAEKAFTTELLVDGTISQEEADDWNKTLSEDIQSFVNESWDWEEETE